MTTSEDRKTKSEQATIARIDRQPFIVGGGVWFPVADHPDAPGAAVPGTLVHIDPATDHVERALEVAATFTPAGSLVAGDSVWLVDSSGSGRILRFPVAAFR